MEQKIRQPVTKGVARVPVVMQMEALECGAASLTMILAYYNKWIPLEKVRFDCGVSRNGSNAGNMLKAARRYGLTAKGFRMEPEALRKKGSFPCILHWNFNHFVVLCGFRGKYAYINDPARGSIKVPMEELDESFTGICLTFQPSEEFQPEGQKKSMIQFARERLSGAGSEVAFVVVISMISYIFTILNPGFARFFTDCLLTRENQNLLIPFILILTGVSALQIFTASLQTLYLLKINGKMAVTGSSNFMWKILRMPVDFFSQRMAGDLQVRKDTNAVIAKTLINIFSPLVLGAVMMVFYLVVMIRYSLILTAAGILSLLLNLFMSRLISLRRINYTRVQMRDEGKLAAATVAGIQMVETIKASGAENGYFSRWAGYQASVNRQNVSFVRLNQYLGAIPAFISQLTNAVVLVMGVWLCIRDQFTLGMILAFQSFFLSFMNPAMMMINAGQTLQEMRSQMERVDDVMEYPEDVRFSENRAPEDGPCEKLRGEVELKNVSFGYSRLADPLIADFSMHVAPGSSVAFVGGSGCGKSTLNKLISGLHQPWSGEILYDGRPMNEIDRDVFTGSVAVVEQDVILFEDTIENNIKMWDTSIEDFEMILAARDAQIHEDIMRRPGGYQNRLAEDGSNLSGGQRQRLDIARALAQDPRILIMDEATSALDARTELDLVQAVKDRGITCIIIAHRLSTIRDCDEIIVLEKGRVVERGTHEELYARGGYYTELIAND